MVVLQRLACFQLLVALICTHAASGADLNACRSALTLTSVRVRPVDHSPKKRERSLQGEILAKTETQVSTLHHVATLDRAD